MLYEIDVSSLQYYFGDFNLATDHYLQTKIALDACGCKYASYNKPTEIVLNGFVGVHLQTIAKFRQIQRIFAVNQLTKEHILAICDALRKFQGLVEV